MSWETLVKRLLPFPSVYFLCNYANVAHLTRYHCRHHGFLSIGTKTGDVGTWKLIKKSLNEKLLQRLCLFVCLSGTAAPPPPLICPRPASPTPWATQQRMNGFITVTRSEAVPHSCCWLPPRCQTIYTPGGRRAWWKTLGFRLLICQPFIILRDTESQTNLSTASYTLRPLPSVKLVFPPPAFVCQWPRLHDTRDFQVIVEL